MNQKNVENVLRRFLDTGSNICLKGFHVKSRRQCNEFKGERDWIAIFSYSKP